MLKAHRQISENRAPKSIVHVMKHVNFQLYRTHPDEVIWKKTDNWQQIYKQTSLSFYTSNDVCKRY